MRTDDLFDIEFGYWFNQSNENLYHHVDVATNIVQLVGGSAAALAAMQGAPAAVVASGVALAVCAALQVLVQPGVKAEQHRVCKSQWRTLKARSLTLDDAALHGAVAELQGCGPSGLATLAVPAFNATMNAIGRETETRPMSWWQSMAAKLS